MTSTLDESVLSRIKKLHDKAESAKAIGSEHEALAFAAAAQKMLLLHQLEDITEVEALLREKQDPVKAHIYRPQAFGIKRSKVRVAWTERLATVVCEAHGCDWLFVDGNTLVLIGTRENRQICEYMLVFLTRFAIQTSYKDYCKFFYQCKEEGDVSMARGYRAGWYTGFVGKLLDRYTKTQQETLQEHDRQAGTPGHGLMVLNKQLQRVNEVTDALWSGKATRAPQGRFNEESSAAWIGAVHGVKAAETVNLGHGLGGGQETRGKVGTGQKQLGSGA